MHYVKYNPSFLNNRTLIRIRHGKTIFVIIMDTPKCETPDVFSLTIKIFDLYK